MHANKLVVFFVALVVGAMLACQANAGYYDEKDKNPSGKIENLILDKFLTLEGHANDLAYDIKIAVDELQEINKLVRGDEKFIENKQYCD